MDKSEIIASVVVSFILGMFVMSLLIKYWIK